MRLRNPTFDEEILRSLGVHIGQVVLFLKKIVQVGKCMAIPPRNASAAVLCLNWHKKGCCWSHCDHGKSHMDLSTNKKMQLIQFLKRGGLANIK
jgi:hypothetical protein